MASLLGLILTIILLGRPPYMTSRESGYLFPCTLQLKYTKVLLNPVWAPSEQVIVRNLKSLCHYWFTIGSEKRSEQWKIFFYIAGTFQVDSTSSPQIASQVLPLPTVPLVSDTPSPENERSIALSDFAVQTSSDRLKVAVEDAKLGSKR